MKYHKWVENHALDKCTKNVLIFLNKKHKFAENVVFHISK